MKKAWILAGGARRSQQVQGRRDKLGGPGPAPSQRADYDTYPTRPSFFCIRVSSTVSSKKKGKSAYARLALAPNKR
jgi:hypothetical protein